ncbi:MAG TPA: sodium/glutamate symporter [Burkholderiaceae bacterium]|nr:sodium/glutamate symporter [Burkholderiaceae bacterium]
MLIELDVFGTLTAASLVLLAGRKLVARIGVLNTYSIPEPVVGGLAVALLLWLLYASGGVQVSFDKTLGPPLMLAFFACIGLNADLPSLLRGGRPLALLLAVVVGFLVLQNLTGVGLAMLLGQSPLVGLLAGSISLSGGHGTGAAWSEVFAQRYQLAGAKEIAIASATFGLVLGGVIGGPVARHLLTKVRVKGGDAGKQEAPTLFEHPAEVRLITAPALIETLALISVCLLVGQHIARALAGTFLELPAFVCVLFVGVVLRNGLAAAGKYTVFERAVSVLGNVSLALFLALALMSMRLWELSSLALPMLGLLLGQTALMAAYAIFVTFPVMGRNYDAAVIAAGHCGFGLGATPTAIANMQAVTDRFGNSALAFLVVPMVGAFFIDLANALVIKLFLLLPLH